MHGKSVSPLIRVRKPTFNVWYQMLNSETEGVLTVEMKSTAPGCVTSTMNSFAPMPSNGGISKLGIDRSSTSSPHPECANPTTAPCDFAHFRIGRSHEGQSSMRC